MSEPALLFGTAAEAYERHRLGYPAAVVDLTLAYARAPAVTALEVGAGTGKATRLFAGRGVEVTACEPDAAMAAVLRRSTAGLPVQVVLSTFEAYGPVTEPFDLLLCAQAWHWTDPATRWDVAASLLRTDGTVALFGTVEGGSRLADAALHEEVGELEGRVLPQGALATDARSASGLWWPGSELESEQRFTDVEEHDLVRSVSRSRREHLGLLGTLSPYLRLSPVERDALLRRIGRVLPDEVDVDATVRLHLARRI